MKQKSACLLDGKAAAAKSEQALAPRLHSLIASGHKPRLDVILVGTDAASQVYVERKRQACERVGIESVQHNLSSDEGEMALLELIHALNQDDRVDGILVQLPLPPLWDVAGVVEAIHPAKDVDGFHPLNVGRLHAQHQGLYPCTPSGVIRLLQHHQLEVSARHAVVVGASAVVGRPMAALLINHDATVTTCHRLTRDLASHTRQADVLVVAAGHPELITADMVKPGAVVVDVGITRLSSSRLVGDVAFEQVSQVASYISPVPGGVGPMTVAMLLENTIKAAELRKRH